MSEDVASLVADMSPYLSAAVGAYGGAVLAKVRDDAANATVSLGRRLLLRVFGSREEGEPLPEPLKALAAEPEDTDALGALRLTIRMTLMADPEAEADVRAILANAPAVTQEVHAGRDAYTAGRDQTNQTIINNFPRTTGPAAVEHEPPPATGNSGIDRAPPRVPGTLPDPPNPSRNISLAQRANVPGTQAERPRDLIGKPKEQVRSPERNRRGYHC